MARFCKADIEFHYDGREAHAAVNVKLYRHGGWDEPDTLPARVARDMGATEAEAEEFAAAWRALSDDTRQGWADMAIDFGWDSLADEAQNAGFPASATVYSEGRSGGWAILATGDAPNGFTREDVAGWDALAVARFARFSRYCAATVANIPYQALSNFYVNRFEPDMADRETARRFAFYYDVPPTFGAASA